MYFVKKLKEIFLLFVVLFSLGVISANALAEVRVLAIGGGLTPPYATEEIFANGDLIGSVDRPSWSVYREWTTEEIVANYDVLLIPYNASSLDWNTVVYPFLASGGGVVWEGYMTFLTNSTPLITQQLGTRYVCPDGTICNIPNSTGNPGVPLDVLPVPGLSDGLTSDFTVSIGYFNAWDPVLSPLVQVDALGLGTITYALYGGVNAGRIMITQMKPDRDATSTGTAAEQNSYNFLKNAIEWSAASTLPPDPNLRFIPDLIHLTEADANAAVSAQGLVVANTWISESNWYVPGTVRGQNPQAGAGAFVGDSLDITVVPLQTGAPVTVPDVTGLSYAEADAVLESVNLFRACCISGNSATVPAGQIITQYPRAGGSSTEGWVVDVVMSNGPAVPLPNGFTSVSALKLMTQGEAEAEIAASGFMLGQVTLQNHPTIPAGLVLDHTIGSLDPAVTPVDIVVSSGPAGTVLVAVPGVVGLTQAAAEAAISNAGLVSSVTTAFSDTVAVGNVISQSPAAGAEAAENSTVSIVVSAGPAPVVISVPDVVGLNQAAAEAAISGAALVVGNVTTASSATVPAGDVISQNPAAGTEVGEGATVDLVVSSGPALVTVPTVVGLTQASAEAAITSAGLALGTVTTTNSDTVPAGNVISQTPTGGTQVTEGANVDLVVSSGPALVTVPNVVGSTYSTAIANINNAGLTVGAVSTVFTRRSCGVVTSQTPVGGTNVQAGSQVNLVVTRTRFCNPL